MVAFVRLDVADGPIVGEVVLTEITTPPAPVTVVVVEPSAFAVVLVVCPVAFWPLVLLALRALAVPAAGVLLRAAATP